MWYRVFKVDGYCRGWIWSHNFHLASLRARKVFKCSVDLMLEGQGMQEYLNQAP